MSLAIRKGSSCFVDRRNLIGQSTQMCVLLEVPLPWNLRITILARNHHYKEFLSFLRLLFKCILMHFDRLGNFQVKFPMVPGGQMVVSGTEGLRWWGLITSSCEVTSGGTEAESVLWSRSHLCNSLDLKQCQGKPPFFQALYIYTYNMKGSKIQRQEKGLRPNSALNVVMSEIL